MIGFTPQNIDIFWGVKPGNQVKNWVIPNCTKQQLS